MKKITVLLLAVIVGGVVSCSKITANPEAEAKALAADVEKIFVDTTEGLNKSADGKEAGAVLIKFTEKMLDIAEKGKEFRKKYPDYAVETNSEELMKKADNKIAKEFQAALMSAMAKYAGSQDFMAAVQKMGTMAQDKNL